MMKLLKILGILIFSTIAAGAVIVVSAMVIFL